MTVATGRGGKEGGLEMRTNRWVCPHVPGLVLADLQAALPGAMKSGRCSSHWTDEDTGIRGKGGHAAGQQQTVLQTAHHISSLPWLDTNMHARRRPEDLLDRPSLSGLLTQQKRRWKEDNFKTQEHKHFLVGRCHSRVLYLGIGKPAQGPGEGQGCLPENM